MQSNFSNFFRSPKRDSTFNAIRAESLHWFMMGNLAVQALFALALLLNIIKNMPRASVLVSISIFLFVITIFLIQDNKKHTERTARIFLFALWVSILLSAWLTGGNHSPFIILLSSAIGLAALTLDVSQILFISLISAASLVVLGLPFTVTIMPSVQVPSQVFVGTHIFNVIVLGLLGTYYFRNDSRFANQIQMEMKKFENLSAELDATLQEAEINTSHTTWRENSLKAIERINQLISNTLPENSLLKEMVQGITETTGITFVSIFILDDTKSNAYLRATNSEAGQALLQGEGYRLAVRRSTVAIGATEAGLPEIIFQIGDSTFRVAHPIPMPETKFEGTFPLAIGDEFIGLLNLQSSKEFDLNEDVEWKNTMAILATQASVVIQNNRLRQNILTYENQLKTITGQRISDAWEKIGTGGTLNYRFDQIHITPLNEKLPASVIDLIQTGKSGSYRTSRGTYALVSPVQLSGQVLGMIGYELDKERQSVYPEELAMLDTVATQLSIALENARLFAETQQRAQSEQLIATVSNKIRESLDLDTVLRAATQEIQQALNVEFAEIRLELPQSDDELLVSPGNGN